MQLRLSSGACFERSITSVIPTQQPCALGGLHAGMCTQVCPAPGAASPLAAGGHRLPPQPAHMCSRSRGCRHQQSTALQCVNHQRHVHSPRRVRHTQCNRGTNRSRLRCKCLLVFDQHNVAGAPWLPATMQLVLLQRNAAMVSALATWGYCSVGRASN
jgi:hypothetical protein